MSGEKVKSVFDTEARAGVSWDCPPDHPEHEDRVDLCASRLEEVCKNISNARRIPYDDVVARVKENGSYDVSHGGRYVSVSLG